MSAIGFYVGFSLASVIAYIWSFLERDEGMRIRIRQIAIYSLCLGLLFGQIYWGMK